jgi:hypothetical protein
MPWWKIPFVSKDSNSTFECGCKATMVADPGRKLRIIFKTSRPVDA